MLLGDFFFLIHEEKTNGTIAATLRLNNHHQIFSGHFPGQPVVPGVCMMQMIKEVIEKHTGNKFMLRSADSIKFLSMIDPGKFNEIDAKIDLKDTGSGGLNVDAMLFSGSVIFFKLRAILEPE